MTFKHSKGFTIIELLITIALIGLLLSIAAFAFDGARKSGRDQRRKTDLAFIQAVMANFYADCGIYLSDHSFACRAGTITTGCNPPGASPITGVSWIAEDIRLGKQSCLPTNIYTPAIPQDPQYPARKYSYTVSGTHQSGWLSGQPSSYIICAALENPPSPAVDTSMCNSTYSNCGDYQCNYVIRRSN